VEGHRLADVGQVHLKMNVIYVVKVRAGNGRVTVNGGTVQSAAVPDLGDPDDVEVCLGREDGIPGHSRLGHFRAPVTRCPIHFVDGPPALNLRKVDGRLLEVDGPVNDLDVGIPRGI
jgi:hypothetical protein